MPHRTEHEGRTRGANRALVLLSGGLDSSVALAMGNATFDIALAVTFDYGQRAASREIEASRGICRTFAIEHRVIDLPWLAQATSTALVDRGEPLPHVSPEQLDVDADSRAAAVWVPNRNGVFIAIAAAIAESAGIDTVIAGFNAEEAAAFPDNGCAFVEATNAALLRSTRTGVRVESPTLALSKAAIARAFVDLSLDPAHLWCCYDGGAALCGRCESCARTIRAFRTIGRWDDVRRRFVDNGGFVLAGC